MKKVLAILLAMLLSMSALTGCGSEEKTEEKNETVQEETAEDKENEDKESEEKEEASVEAGNMVSKQCEGNILTWNLAYDTENLDPAQSVSADSRSLVNNLFEGLMRDTGDGVKPALAADMPVVTENKNGTVTLTYTLIDSKWSDGQPVTAKDFEYGWKRCADPENGAANAYLMSVLDGYSDIAQGVAKIDSLGVKAVDEKTLEVTLKQPTAYFNDLLALPAFMPVREDMQNFKDPKTAVSNGPFVLAGYTQGKEMILKKNPEYHNAEEVSLDYVIARMLNDNFGPVAMAYGDVVLTSGKVEQPADQTDTEGNTVKVPELPKTLEETTINSNTVVNLLVNANTSNSMLKNHKVRAALSLGLDRKAAAEAAGNAIALTSATGMSGEMLPASPEIEDAKKMMDEYFAANPNADKTIEIVFLKNDELQAALETVQKEWTDLGLEVTLTAQDAETYKKSRNSLQYADIICSVWEADVQDGQQFLEPFLTSNMQSGCGYTNTEFDEAMIAAIKAEGSAREEKLTAAETVLLKDAYVMPLYQKTLTATSDAARINGWKILPNGAYWFGDTALGAAASEGEAETEKAETEKSEEEKSEDKKEK